MVITRMRLTEKGISLVVLIVAITVMSILGAGIASLVGSRQKSYPMQVHSYQAYMAAHAGIEFAIRYAYDNQNDFKTDPAKYIPSAPAWKTPITLGPVNDGRGMLRFRLQYSANNGGTLTSEGHYTVPGAAVDQAVARRTVILQNFREYANLN
jgi:type II secretory pathway component PulK